MRKLQQHPRLITLMLTSVVAKAAVTRTRKTTLETAVLLRISSSTSAVTLGEWRWVKKITIMTILVVARPPTRASRN